MYRCKNLIKNSLSMLTVMVFLASPGYAQAQEEPTEKPATEEAVEAEKSEAPTAKESADVSTKPAVGSNEDLLEKATEVKEAVDELKNPDEGMRKKLAIAALIAAITNLLLSGLKRVAKLTDKGKKYLPWAAAALGAVVVGASKFALGTGWFDAIFYGGAALGAVVIQELGLGPVKSKEKAAAK